MYVGFTGTQKGLTYQQEKVVTFLLEKIANQQDESNWFHHGDCIGSDFEASLIARKLGYMIYLHPPIENKKRVFGYYDLSDIPREYLTRNKMIVKASCNMIATPAGEEILRSGTWSTIRYAKKIGCPLRIVYPEGHIEAYNLLNNSNGLSNDKGLTAFEE